MLVPMLLGTALFLFTMEMWARHHPPALPGQGQAQEDTLVFMDRFQIADSGLFVPAVVRYLEFVSESGSHGGLIHNYINSGSRKLALALRGVSELNLRVTPLEKMH